MTGPAAPAGAKPTGPLPPAFARQRGELTIAGRPAGEWAAAGDTPLFLYDAGIVAGQVRRFRAAFPGVDLHYAVKANPFPPLLDLLAGLVDGFDVASAGELALVAGAGRAIGFAGPGKRDRELAAAVAAGATISLESTGELARALAVAERLGVRPRLAVRVNPGLELRGAGMRMGGRPSPFGIDAEDAADAVRRVLASGAEWRGLHIYAGSQALDAGAVLDAQAETLRLARLIADQAGAEPPLVNLGGGFGVPYFANEAPLDVERVGAGLAALLAPWAGGATRFALELGRWLVAEAGVYLARIVDRKASRGELFLVVDGGLHHQLAATGNLGTVVRRNYPLALAGRMGEPAAEVASVVGPLCTPLDRLGDRVALPRGAVGELVAVFLAGAYGATASPAAFLGHPPALERLVGAD